MLSTPSCSPLGVRSADGPLVVLRAAVLGGAEPRGLAASCFPSSALWRPRPSARGHQTCAPLGPPVPPGLLEWRTRRHLLGPHSGERGSVGLIVLCASALPADRSGFWALWRRTRGLSPRPPGFPCARPWSGPRPCAIVLRHSCCLWASRAAQETAVPSSGGGGGLVTGSVHLSLSLLGDTG